MSKTQQSDTDLIEIFKENIQTLGGLIQRIEHEFQTSTDPIVRAKLKDLKAELLVEDVKLQESKIEKISKVLKEICLPTASPND